MRNQNIILSVENGRLKKMFVFINFVLILGNQKKSYIGDQSSRTSLETSGTKFLN